MTKAQEQAQRLRDMQAATGLIAALVSNPQVAEVFKEKLRSADVAVREAIEKGRRA